MIQSDDKPPPHKTGGMEISIKPGYNPHRFIHVFSQVIEIQVVGRNQTIPEQVIAYMPVPALPISPTRLVDQYQGPQPTLTGLHQSKRFEPFIKCSESSRIQNHCVRLPDER